jgi:hypothetical protein
MTEGNKTLVYVGLAAFIGLIAYVTKPQPAGLKPSDTVGKPLFEAFNDPLKASSLEIVNFDPASGKQPELFRVTQNKDKTWSIPSHGDYPADAENQLRDAATAFVDLKPLGIASEVGDDHAQFGVLMPDKDKTKPGEQGVGQLVKLQDESGKPLAQLIIGKVVKKAEDQRFVRVPSQDIVYVVKIDPKKFTTKFGDWIEKDLLKLNAFDVERVKLKDYSVFRAERGFRMDPRLDATMTYQSDSSQWNLDSLLTYVRGRAVPTALSDTEELNKDKIEALKTALDDLQIVDVQRKPKGLTADLKADAGFMNDQEGIDSLFQRGFFPLKPPTGDQIELFSANGEVHVGMKDGIEYILRFGNFASVEEGSADAKLNRYLFVMAQLDESKFPPPQLESEPAIVPESGPAKPAEKPAAQKPAAEKPDGGNGGACSTAAANVSQDTAAEAKPADAKPDDAKPEAKPADAKPEAKTEAKPEAKTEAKTEAKPVDAKPVDAKPADKAAEKPADAEKPAEKPAPKIDIAAERERIKKENQRKIDEAKEKRKKAEARVFELNARFADWYYVISEETYKKIHLGRADIIREKTGGADEGTGLDAFRKLQKDGLKKGAPATTGAMPPGGFGGPGGPGGFGAP